MYILSLITLSGLLRPVQPASVTGYQTKIGITSILGTSFGNPGVDATYDYVVGEPFLTVLVIISLNFDFFFRLWVVAQRVTQSQHAWPLIRQDTR